MNKDTLDPGLNSAANAPDEPQASILSKLATLQETVLGLKACFEERLQYDAAKDRAFDVLYAKLREQDTDQSAALKKNLILALLRLHDHMHEAEAALDEGSPGRLRMADLRMALLDILYAEDVEPIPAPEGQFDRARQQAVGSLATHDPAQENTIERVSRAGFTCGTRVLRPQAVIVRRYQPSPKSNP